MPTRRLLAAFFGGALVCSIATTSFGQTPEPVASPAAPVASAASPAPPAGSAPSPGAAPPPPVAVPPGYMLVPIPGPDAQTRYDVQYPQGRGALPPGMELPYEEGDPIPPGYRLIEQRRRGLIIAGSILVGAPWVIGVTAATAMDFREGTGLLLVPVLGPWLMLATKSARDGSCGTDDLCDSRKATLRAGLVLDGLVQTGGAVMFVAGFLVPRKRLVRRDVVVSVLPARLGNGAYGLGVSATF